MAEERLITGLKEENSNETVSAIVRRPNGKDLKDAKIEYNKAMRVALENKTMLRLKLNDYLTEQGIWSDDKQRKYEEYISKINEKELILKKGGIPLKKAKSTAFELKRLRVEFRDLIAERTSYDNNTAEGLADNAQFDCLVSLCVLDPATKAPIFKNIEDYNIRSSEPWAIKAASELANMIYNLDPSYEDNLPENKFLKSFKFADDKGRLVNKEGHLIAVDENDVERLIDENNRYIAYDSEGNKYFVTRDGKPVQDETFTPFIDDDGNALDENGNIIVQSSTTDEVVSEESVKKPKKKKSDTE
jgi:hypothetical protein